MTHEGVEVNMMIMIRMTMLMTMMMMTMTMMTMPIVMTMTVVMWVTLRRCMTHDGVKMIMMIMMMMMMIMMTMTISSQLSPLFRTLPCHSMTWCCLTQALKICTRYKTYKLINPRLKWIEFLASVLQNCQNLKQNFRLCVLTLTDLRYPQDGKGTRYEYTNIGIVENIHLMF